MDSKLTAEQEKLAALIESDYALLKSAIMGRNTSLLLLSETRAYTEKC